MDLHTLSNLFTTTYNPDPNVRKAAELQIRKISGEEGMVSALLQIIASGDVELATRQTCAVYLKNKVQRSSVSGRPDHTPIHPSDREALKSSILRLLAASPSRGITLQLASTLKAVVQQDVPNNNWPELLDSVKAFLHNGDIRDVHAGCVASLEIVRAFRFNAKVEVMNEIVSNLFPILVDIATRMLSTPPSASQDVPAILHLIMKTYKTSIILHLSPHQQSAASLVPWGQLLFAVVNLPIPKEAVPEDEDERERSEWWKTKKWAYYTLGRLFHRFGNPSQLPSLLKRDYLNFAQHFVTAFAPEIFKAYLHQVELFISNQAWLSKKCRYQIFSFLTECIKPKSTWQLLKPHVETLIQSFVFPELIFTPAVQEVWEHDPVDFIRVTVDEHDDHASLSSSATTFIIALISSRTKATFLPIVGFINNILQSHSPPAQKYGALHMTVSVGPLILRHPDLKNNIEQFMMRFVLPEFSSAEPYMRTIACQVLTTMQKARLAWTSEENMQQHFNAVANALGDPELPVRVHASLALTELIIAHESVRIAVAPQVGKVIQDLLKLSEETELDILNYSMEVMVQRYHTELLPVAVQLTARLCESYLRLARENVALEEAEMNRSEMESVGSGPEEDKTFAAMGVAKTLSTIITSIESSPDILTQVREVIIPVVVYTLENKLFDLFYNMYDLVDDLTFKLRSITPTLWPVFELTYQLLKSDAIDFLDEMLPALDNFVSFGKDVFQNRPDYRLMILDIYNMAMTSDHLGENDRVNGCKLAESLLLNLRGHADDQLQPIVLTALDHLDKGLTTAFRLANLEVLINAILYNPHAALAIMESSRPGMARLFFDKWFEAINSPSKLPRVHDKKLSITALCELLRMDPSTIPPNLSDGWSGIVAGILKIFKDLPHAIQSRKELEEQYAEDSDDEELIDDDEILNLNEDDEDVWNEDSAYMEMLANEGARLREKSAAKATDADDGYESSETEIDEELGFLSPLDDLDPYIAFQQTLTNLQMINAPCYQVSTTSLDMEQQTLLMEVMRTAEARAGVTNGVIQIQA